MSVTGSMTSPRSQQKKIVPELLAPAGDFACLQAALQSGCDAVYLGLADMNMRKGAANFATEDLPNVYRRCRDAGAAVYLTLNTIVYPNERSKIQQLINRARQFVDAVICWDPFVIQECRREHIPIHISTQAAVSNPEAAKMYKEMGAVRVVAARECSIGELKQIRDESGVEIEVFVHGAMCVSVSGRCYLSDLVCGKSGNRGECTQNCRREYAVTDIEDGHQFVVGNHYVMSAQDLCTLPFIDLLCDAGLNAFKIEGRGRNPEYVQTVVSAYRRAIDAWATDGLTDTLKDALVTEVKTVYNRGFCDGFYFGRPIGDFTNRSGNSATHKKEFVGRVTNYYRKAQVVEVDVRDRVFDTQTRLFIIGDTTGVVTATAEEIRQNDKRVPRADRGIVTFPLKEKVRIGDKVYRQVERESPELENRKKMSPSPLPP